MTHYLTYNESVYSTYNMRNMQQAGMEMDDEKEHLSILFRASQYAFLKLHPEHMFRFLDVFR